MDIVAHWPLFGLRVRTPRIELRYPNDDEISRLAERAAAEGVHDPASMPFSIAWTDVDPPLQQQQFLQYHWALRSGWRPERWTLNMVAVVDGRVVGTQAAEAEQFALTRSAMTGSFLVLAEQARGYGTEMRAAVLHLLFAGLDAERAETAAWEDNEASLRVTSKLGYEQTGRRWLLSRGVPRRQLTFELSRSTWLLRRRHDITIEGLDPCRTLFGVPG